MNYPTGNTSFVWKIKDLPGDPYNTPDRTAQAAISRGFKSLLIKVANGIASYNWRKLPSGAYDDTLIGPFVDACDAVGVDVWAWSYYYGEDPVNEAKMASSRMHKYPKLKGLIIDAEGECKQAGLPAARLHMQTMRNEYDGPLGMTSFRWPSLHTDFPWSAFVGAVDFQVPQVYWVDAHNPAAQLDRCISEYNALYDRIGKPRVPIIPAGAAYHENGFQPTLAEMSQFSERARVIGLPGISWWEWANAVRYGLDAGMVWSSEQPPSQPPATIEQRITGLEAWARTKGYAG